MSTLTAKRMRYSSIWRQTCQLASVQNIQSLANVAESSLGHQHTGPASPAPTSAQGKGTKHWHLGVLQRRSWLRSALLPVPSFGSHLQQTFLKKGYLQVTCHMRPREKTQSKQKEISWSVQSTGRKPHSQCDLCFLFQDVPWRGAPWPHVTGFPVPAGHDSGKLPRLTVLPGMAGSLWRAGSAPFRRAASSHPHAMGGLWQREGLWRSGLD